MIKKLFYIAALLLPGLAYGGSPSADLSVQVVPSGAGIACDVGPNYAGSVPAPAQAAGFTHCALNADFTSAAFSNPNTWLAECGAGPTSNSTYFRLIFADQVHGAVTPAPCNRALMINDNGVTVLDPQVRPSDFTNNSYTYLAVDWPSSEWGAVGLSGPGLPAGGPNGTGLPDTQYVEIVFRTPPSSWQGFTGDSSVMDFWLDECNGCGGIGNNGYTSTQPPEPEIDFFETHSAYFSNGQMRLVGFGTCPTDGSSCANADVYNYHTYGFLTTSDGVTNLSQCLYIDNVLSNCSQRSDYTRYTHGKVLAWWLSPASCFGNGFGCLNVNFDTYIKSIRLWECDQYWGQNCFGPLITGATEQKTKFAWIEGVLQSIKTSIGSFISPASAQEFDPFDGHYGGYWTCANGTLSYKFCMPPEFKGKEWWKTCLPGRSDCVWSATAFLGQSVDGPLSVRKLTSNYAIRGSGYCYKEQPYTCSPDGKLPQ